MTKQRRFSVKKMALKSTFGFATVNHNYTEEERQILNSYHSLEYLPPHSKVEREREGETVTNNRSSNKN
jgi:hypothetical protein